MALILHPIQLSAFGLALPAPPLEGGSNPCLEWSLEEEPADTQGAPAQSGLSAMVVGPTCLAQALGPRKRNRRGAQLSYESPPRGHSRSARDRLVTQPREETSQPVSRVSSPTSG